MSHWGDFTRKDDGPVREYDGHPLRAAWAGFALLVAGAALFTLGLVLSYADLKGPNDSRGDRLVPYLWTPGAAIAAVGLALIGWGWWRKAHAD
jgi:hypothetical protein